MSKSVSEGRRFLERAAIVQFPYGAENMNTNPPDEVSETTTTTPLHETAWRDFGRNILNGIKLAAFMRVRAEDLHASWPQLVAFIFLGLAATFVIDFSHVGLKGQFYIYGLPGVLFYVPLTIITAWAISLIGRRPDDALALAVALLALAVPVEIVDALYRMALPRRHFGWMGMFRDLVHYLPYLWLILAASVTAVRILEVRLALRGPVVLVAALLLVLPQAIGWRGQIWMEPYDEARASRMNLRPLTHEDAFYLQPKLLERELAGLKRGRKGTVELYFVGIAGYANQDVFMKEVNSISELMRQRFDTEGRSVRLINNSKSVAEVPIASVTALKATLTRVAELMDRDEDILFLYLTSHGSKEHQFSLEFWPLNFNLLDPATLRQLLDDSGIKRRVVIVSACYSGGFIDPLKDENSLVITAAARDRNSFGCENGADFTYFGKAYFDEALRETRSFVDAFKLAAPKIALREKEKDFDGSDPQIFVGQNIARPLADLENRLSQLSVATSGPAPEAHAQHATVKGKYAKFAELWITPELIARSRAECFRGMNETSPTSYTKKDPNYFGGLNERSRHWPRLMIAWAKYSEEYCAALNNETLYRDVSIDAWQHSLSESDLDAMTRFLSTDLGQRFIKANNQMSLDLLRKLTASSAPLTDRATKRFQESQVLINADFERDRKISAKN